MVSIARNGEVTLSDIALLYPDRLAGTQIELTEAPKSKTELTHPSYANLDVPMEEQVKQLEIQLIRMALDFHGGNRSQAARQLGLSRQGLINKSERYGL